MRGTLKKMPTQLNPNHSEPVLYDLPIGEQLTALNPLIGKPLKLVHTGNIFCIHCQRQTKKSFNQGYCYPCFSSLAQCDMCIVKPETCHYHAGTCREPEWGESFCFQPHIVYLANSSGVKVGITRQTQIPTRWIDQGAVQALPILRVRSRYISGLIESALAKHVSDKTSWQQMLKSNAEPVDLAEKRDELMSLCATDINRIEQQSGPESIELLDNETVTKIRFPVDNYPLKIKSFNLDKAPEIAGVLHGIKGQYLIFDSGVINIRKYAGYEVEFFA